MELHLIRPLWLWTLMPALVLLLLLWRQRGRSGSWQSVIAPDLLRYLVNGTASRSANLLPLVFLGWLLAAVAASGPSWQKIPQPVQQKQDALVVLLDLSYSMKSGDLVPSRLDRARQKLLDLLQQRREGQTGLIAYAGDAHIVTPLTDDTLTIANLLPALQPDMMPLPGSEPVSAVTQALELLRSAGIARGKLLLVTDGISAQDSEGIQKVLSGSDVQLTIMGVGTATGAPIPLPNGGFLKDAAGTIVMPGLDEQALRELAGATGGSYRRMQLDDSDLETLLAESPLDGTEETLALDRTADTWEDQGYLLVLVLLPLVLGLFRRGWLLTLLPVLLPVLLLVQPEPASAQTWDNLWLTPDQQGQRALQQGDNAKAAILFENPDWAGTAAYQNNDYELAAQHFKDPNNADSLYNRGNALAKEGKLDEAIAAYEQSLTLQPDQADAQENLDLLKKLKEQQQNQSQQDQDKQQNQDQKQDQDQQQQGQDQQQQGQDQQQQGQDQQQQQQQQGQDQQQQSQDQQQQGQDQQQQGQDQQQQDQDQQQQGQNQQQGQDKQQEQQSGSQDQEQKGSGQEQQADAEKQQQARAENAGKPTDEESGKEAEGQAAQERSGDDERDQAMEQWLRRVPDDPSGLLREKFRYESMQRQQQGVRRDDEANW